MSSDEFAATYVQEMRDRIKNQRIEELERKVALLEAFVAAEDAFNDNAQSEDWDEDDALYYQMLDARAALDWLPR